jgi:hypothetical protein
MFTVLSNTRNSNLFLIGALAIVVAALLTLAIVPAIPAPQAVVIPAAGRSEVGSDYYQRHPELNGPVAIAPDLTSDFALRHPKWVSVAAPVTSNLAASDYFQRHPEFRTPNTTIDLSDYFLRH